MRSKLLIAASLLLLFALLNSYLWFGNTPPLLAGGEQPASDCTGNSRPKIYLPIVINAATSNRTSAGTDAALGQSQHTGLQRNADPIEIAIGDVVSQTITPSEPCYIYTFDATPGQTVFFAMETIVNVGSLTWNLEDSQGARLFDDCLACGDPGVITLTQGGTYTITVGQDTHNLSGSYSFSLQPVNATDTFSIALDDVISNGVPSAGAGNIETFGAHDIYTFSATAGQSVYFDIQSVSSGLTVRWQLKDSSGAILFEDCLACGDPGLISLALGGDYIITVGTVDSASTGTYQFELIGVASNDLFEIEIGDQVSDGVPSQGAGNIETAGALDIYTFNATAGQTVHFDMQSFSPGLTVRWQLNDSTGAQLFRTCLACGDPGDIQLTAGGTYTITVGTLNSPATGTYQFQTLDHP